MSEFDEPLSATRRAPEQVRTKNLDRTERTLSLVGGGALLFNGLREGGVGGLLQAGMGALLAWRGASGHCRLKQATTASPLERRLQQHYGWRNLEALSRSVTIARPRSEVFQRLAEPDALVEALGGVERIEALEDGRSRWTFGAPLGKTFELTLKREECRDDERLVWMTEDARWLPHRCTLSFADAPHGRGTELRVLLACEPPAGRVGYAAASLFGRVTGTVLMRELRRLKQYLETGEIPTAGERPAIAAQAADKDERPSAGRTSADSAASSGRPSAERTDAGQASATLANGEGTA